MPFIARQARRSEMSETDACGLGPRDRLLDWLIAQPARVTDASVSASLLGLSVTYEGKVLDPMRVVLHRSRDRIAPPRDSAPQHAGDRRVVPGEFLG
jgi:hypothetical protein